MKKLLLSAIIIGGGMFTTFQTNAQTQEVLLEQFTSELCGNCPGGANTINTVITNMTEEVKVSWVAHHAGYYTDFLTLPESQQLLPLYGGGGTFAPAFMVNRNKVNGKTVFGVSPTNVKNLIKYAKQNLAPGITLESEMSYDNNRTLKIKVKALLTEEFTGGNDLHLNVALTEDGIQSHNQAGANTNYIHKHVLRKLLGGAIGKKVDPSDASYEWTFDIPDTWKVENMKVIVFAHHSKNSPTDHSIYRSREYPFPPMGQAIGDILDQQMNVYAQNGNIIIDGTYKSFRVFDMQGRMVSAKNLNPGIYVVSIEANTGKVIKKVVVK